MSANPSVAAHRAPTLTVRHDEERVEILRLCSNERTFSGVGISAEVTYAPGQHLDALRAIERMAESLRKQIADAAESGPR